MTQPANQPPGWWQPPGGQQPDPPQGAPAPDSQPPAPAGPGYPQGQTPGQQWGQQWPAAHWGQPQWGQATPPAGQPGTPGQWPTPGWAAPGAAPSTYGGFGAFEGTSGKRPKNSKKLWFTTAGVVVVLAGGGVAAWLLGAFSGAVLEQESVQQGVATVLREDFGEGDVRNVQCPANQPARAGTVFECSVNVAGQPKKVTIRVLNDQPQFEVGAPK